jgi:transposase
MYCLDIRKIACRLYEKYNSLRKVSLILEISHSTIARWLKNIQRKCYYRKPNVCNDFVVDTIKSSIAINPFISTRNLVTKIKSVCNLNVSKELVRSAIAKLGYTKKQSRFFSQPKNLEEKTKVFKELRQHFLTQNKSFYSLDETSFGRNIKTPKGYALKGQMLKVPKMQPRITTLSSLVIMSKEGIIKHQEIQGSFNQHIFLSFLRDVNIPNDSVILLDNVKFHHCTAVKDFATLKGWTLLFTPPYSPWFNPIEGVFSIMKRLFYKGNSIQECFNGVTQHHCKSFFEFSFKH